MSRKLFCEINPFFYNVSVCKERIKRNMINFFNRDKLAKCKCSKDLPYIIKSHTSLILRKLHNVDMKLQINKKTNLEIASNKINRIIIKPGEIFSFWYLVGKPSGKKGYKEGLVISKNGFVNGVGGGLCQLANMIHYLVLNSPLEVVEIHHHSDALFPDERRRVPFGTGTSVFYNYLDYRFKNNTTDDIQLLLWVDDDVLCGELRGNIEFPYRYRLEEVNHHFKKENYKFYRNSQVYKITIDRKTNKEINRELILSNHSEVMYDYTLIPSDEIKDDEYVR
ncbi:MAG: VanW family protein [Bacilli bacterium]|nr:VanW family protein [Bacilli bacterium]